jgi:hypothetical protein
LNESRYAARSFELSAGSVARVFTANESRCGAGFGAAFAGVFAAFGAALVAVDFAFEDFAFDVAMGTSPSG